MINPFYLSTVAYLIAILVFSLKWSGHYQDLERDIYLFFAFNILINSVVGFTFRKKLKFVQLDKEDKKINKLNLFIFLGYLVVFLYSKEIPLINIIFGTGNYYKDIEMIPGFFPLLMAINVFTVIYTFYHYVSFKDKKYFYHVLFLLLPIILYNARGILIMTLIPCFLLFYAAKGSKFMTKRVLKIIGIALISFYIFGYAGNLRSTEMQLQGFNDANELILSLGDAVGEFRESMVPSELFWVYLYIASPIANFNAYINNSHQDGQMSEFIIYNFFPQSFQKYILTGDEIDPKEHLVVDTFNASTAYAIPYKQFGWLGVFLYQIGYYVFFCICFIMLHGSRYKSVLLSLYSVIALLSLFYNMLVLDVLMIPIFLCLIFNVINKIKIERAN